MTQIGQWASWIGEIGETADAAMVSASGVPMAPGASGSGSDGGVGEGEGGASGGPGGRGGGGGGGRGEGPGGPGGAGPGGPGGRGGAHGQGKGWDKPSGAAGYLASPGKQSVAKTVEEDWRKAGASDAAIAGLLANLRDETGLDPKLRHYDQPRYSKSDEAGYAHGLYQEGAEEWKNMEKWLHGRDWRDPHLQNEFVIQNLQRNYPDTWARMNRGSKEEAAQAFLKGYLRPAAGPMAARSAKYGRGVPGIEFYTRGAAGTGAGYGAATGGGGGGGGFYQGSGRPLGSVPARFATSGSVNTRLDPVLTERLNAAYAAAPAGQKFRVISGYRDNALQARLYSNYKAGRGGVAAPPGRSQHNLGRAADIGRGAGFDWIHRHAREYGLVFPHSFDQPHIQVDPSK